MPPTAPDHRPSAIDRALHALRAAHELPPAMPGREVVLTLVARPAFHNWESWTIAVADAPPDPAHPEAAASLRRMGPCRLRKCVWDKGSADDLFRHLPPMERHQLVDPRIVIHDRDVPAATWASLSRELANCRVPVLLAHSRLGLDGVTFTLRTGDHMGSAEIEWWCDGPPEWAPLCRWAERFRAKMDALAAE